eukprot:SM000087S23399  [mRNA]  locus=s87:562705:572069:+ [translate_table: standard]
MGLDPEEPLPSSTLRFVLNGRRVEVASPDPAATLAEYIRDVAHLKGTKVSCAQGGCGACTVAIAPVSGGRTLAVNSCLRPLCSMDGLAVTTVEGVGSQASGLSDLQKRLVQHNGTQCGFCTPGFVMSMHSLLKETPEPSKQRIEDQLDGNICRCTGYRPILEVFQSFAAKDGCAPSSCSRLSQLDMEDVASCHLLEARPKPFRSYGGGVEWVRACRLSDLQSLLRKHAGDIRMVCGSTSTGIYPPPPKQFLVDIASIPELRVIEVDRDGLKIGGAVSIADLKLTLEENASLSRSYAPLASHIGKVAHPLVRNVGSVSGNLVLAHTYASFISDMATILMGAGASLHVAWAKDGREEVIKLETFFSLLSLDGLVILALHLPVLPSSSVTFTQRISQRKVHAHAIVVASFVFALDKDLYAQKTPCIVYGGVQKGPQHATKTEAFLHGKCLLDTQVVGKAMDILTEEMAGDMTFKKAEYRERLIQAFFFKAVLSCLPPKNIPQSLVSAATEYTCPVSSGTVDFDTDEAEYPVSKPISKLSAAIQTTGESIYTDDTYFAHELYGAYVLTTEGNAAIAGIDASAALALEGVVSFFSSETLAKDGYCNQLSEYEELFATKRSQYCGQVAGLVVAKTLRCAREAVELVKIEYADISSPLLTIEDAIIANSFFNDSRKVVKQGSVKVGMSEADTVVEGEVCVGHCKHFHLELQKAVAVPTENDGISIYASSQHPSQVIVNRVGGAYGAKINRSTPVGAAAAIAAHKLRKPAVGGRSPYMIKYKVGLRRSGKLAAIMLSAYNNHGAHRDLDGYPDMDMLFVSIDNVYKCPNWEMTGICARTNLPSSTYMRGPGYVEAVFFAETMIEHAAKSINMPAHEVKHMNMYERGDVIPTKQILSYCNAKMVFESMKNDSNYVSRLKDVERYNKGSRWAKRGINMMPIRFSAAWHFLQYTAMVNVYPDGSVVVHQSGIECGQGLDVKVAQVAALTLGMSAGGGVPLEKIRVEAVDTNVASNGSCTGGSVTSELNAMAVREACKIIVKRLEVVAAMMAIHGGDQPEWEELVYNAVVAGVDLQARSRIHPPQSKGGTFQYMSYGAAVSEVEVDILTGDTRILRSDVLLDCGTSLNPAVDVGQVHGAFIMGIGYYLMEECAFDNNTGKLLTDDTWEYKVALSKDIPRDFRVALLRNSANPSGFLRSKKSGEPPLGLAASVLIAVAMALSAARAESGDASWVSLSAPATVEKVALATPVSLNDLLNDLSNCLGA